MPKEIEKPEEKKPKPILSRDEMKFPKVDVGPNLLSPEALLVLTLAVILDLVGLILFFLSFIGIGIPLSFILDIIGLVLIGSWMFFRTGHITTTKKAEKIIKKGGRKLLKRLGLAFLGEIIPFFGDIAPCWTLAVYFELKNNPF